MSTDNHRTKGGGYYYGSRNIEKISPLLDLDEPFTIRDVDGYSRKEWTGLVNDLDAQEVINPVGWTYEQADGTEYESNPSRKWEFARDLKERLREYRAELDTLPCGHHGHVKTHGDGTYGCKFCDEKRHYSRETIENAL